MKSELLDVLDHDLAASIRNFEVAEGLLNGPDADLRLAAKLLRASIKELHAMREGLSKMDFEKDDNKPSNNAQKEGRENHENQDQ